MLNRRQFHARLLASLAAAALPRGAVGAAPGDSADLWLNRLTFGATDAARATFRKMGPLAWLDHQLALPPEDADLSARLGAARLRIEYPAGSDENGNAWPALNEARALTRLSAPPAENLSCIDWTRGMDFAERSRPADEVIHAALLRALHAPAQLREVMTQFWHDHFNVHAGKDEYTAAFFPSHDAALRAGALGNFRALLGATARAPVMLYYLNNADSRAAPANENYARELLELHTLGAPAYVNDLYDKWGDVPRGPDGLAAGYLDLDVYEVARAFTGWSVGDGRYVDEGVEAPKTGQFHYIESWHDPAQKRILGREFAPNRAPMADGEEVLDMLARHPATARFICSKIARRLLTDTPDDALVSELAAVFARAADAPDQIAQVIRALVLHPDFAATPPQKLRRPFEFLAALYRASGAEFAATDAGLRWQLARAGWQQHSYGPPTGHPDEMAAWTGASTLNRLCDFALNAHEDWFAVVDAQQLAQAQNGESVADFARRHAQGGDAGDVIAAFGADPAALAGDFPQEDRRAFAAAALGFAALSPQFLLR